MVRWNDVSGQLNIAWMQSGRTRYDHLEIIEIHRVTPDEDGVIECHIDFSFFEVARFIHDAKERNALVNWYSGLMLE